MRSFVLSSSAFVAAFLLFLYALLQPGVVAAQGVPARFPGTTQVGQPSAALAVLVSMRASGTAVAPDAVTEGIAAGEFAAADGGTCAAGQAYTAGQTCTVQIVFTPHFPGRRSGAVLLKDTYGNLLGSTQILGLAAGPLPRLAPGRIDTVAGDRSWIYAGDGGGAIGAPIFLPQGLAVDVAGNLFISDSGNSRIRRVDAATGSISTAVGTGTPGYNGEGALGTATTISQPAGLALDGAGNLYFADSGNALIRRLDRVSGRVSTVAGTPSLPGYAGDGGPAVSANLTLPEGIAFDEGGNLLVADTGNNVVRLVDAVTGRIRTLAGTGTAGFSGDGSLATQARLDRPWNLLVAPDGSILIADFGNDRVRKVSSGGVITTLAGNGARGFSGDGGSPGQASLDAPTALVMDPAGDLYIADSGNNRVRMISISDGNIQTLAGNSADAFTGDGGPANQASLYGPYALLFDAEANLFVADMFHNRVRRISGQAITLAFPTIRVSKTSQPQTQGLTNAGNAALTLATPDLVNAALDANTSDCLTAAVAAGASCSLGVEFAPTAIGTLVRGSVAVNSDAGGTAPVITVQGQVLSVEPTSTALTVNANPALVGDSVQLAATVASDDSSRSGGVVFFDGSTRLCAATLNSGGVASCSTSSLVLGQHNLTANYAGDANNASSTSPAVIEVIKQSPRLVLEATPNPAVVTAAVALRVSASATVGTPSGTVSFLDGTTLLGTAALNATGVATITNQQLAPGAHALTAQYAGDAANAAGSSNTVNETIEQASTVTTLSSSKTATTVGESLTLTAQVSNPSGTSPTGSLTFRDGLNVLGVAPLDANGRAALSFTSLAPGSHSFTADYAGDTNNAASTSVVLSGNVAQVTTTVTVSASANPLSAGAVLRLNATLSTGQGAGAAGPLAGTVTFNDGATVLGTDVLDAAGYATLAVPGLTVGTHPIVASFAGSTNYAASSSAALDEVVASTATATALTSSTAGSLAGRPVTFNVNVSSATGVPTGTVTLRDNASVVGQAAVSDHGTAAFMLTSLSVGTHTLSASYSGDASYSPSASTPSNVSVSLAQSVLILSGPATPVNAGVAAMFTVTITSSGLPPSGTLSLRDGAVVIATQAIGSGTVSFSSDTLVVGAHSLTVSYIGDENNAAANSNVLSVSVQQAPTATVLTGSSPVTLGSNLTLLASTTSSSPHLGGSTTLQEGATVLGTATVGADGVARFTISSLAAGDHALTAIYGGDANHAASSATALSVRVVEPSSGILSSTLNPAVSGLAVLFTAHFTGTSPGSSSAVPTGTIVFTDNGNTLGTMSLDANGVAPFSSTSLTVGVHAIQAVYSGDAHFAAASASLSQSIASASTQMTLTTARNPTGYAAPVMLVASVTSNGGAATGSVSFLDDQTVIGNALLNAQGVAQLTLSTLSPGTHTITAAYAGDGRAAASASGPLKLSVKQTTSVTLSSSANPALTLSAVRFTASIGNAGAAVPTGTVTFLDGANELGSASLDSVGRASLNLQQMLAGTHAITARYDGDEKDFASQTAAALSQIVQRRMTSTALTSSATNVSDPQQVTLIALVHGDSSVIPGGTVTFRSGSSLVGTSPVDATGIATLTLELETKQENVTASYGGDASYLESGSAEITVTAGAATQFTLQVNPTEVSLASKQRVSVTLTLQSVKGFNDTLKLGCLGLPFAATCTFSAPEMKLTADGTATIQLTLDTGNPLGAGAQTAQARNGSRGGDGDGLARSSRLPSPAVLSERRVLLCFLPAALLLLCGRNAKRRFTGARLLTILLAAGLTFAASGCSGLKMNGTPAGAYTLKVTASGVGTGATQSQTVMLKVTE